VGEDSRHFYTFAAKVMRMMLIDHARESQTQIRVTRVLEHLDRMAKDAHGDRPTELDLVDAYTKLGNLLDNRYEQNLGDTAGALASLNKAIVIAQPLAASNPKDRDALEALAKAQVSRSQVEFWSGALRPQEAVASIKAATAVYDRLAALPDVTPMQLVSASRAYNTLGDEMGQNGSSGLADLPAALAAYRKGLNLGNRALALNPSMVEARRSVGNLQIKIGNVELETDPTQALKDIEIALEDYDALPEADRKSPITVRGRAILERKKAMAL
jgi:tetratricopeptide (TPR) repeat protein